MRSIDTKTTAWPNTGIQKSSNALIREGLTNEAVLERILEQFPSAGTKINSIRWYRNELRKSDPTVPTQKEARAQANGEPIDRTHNEAQKIRESFLARLATGMGGVQALLRRTRLSLPWRGGHSEIANEQRQRLIKSVVVEGVEMGLGDDLIHDLVRKISLPPEKSKFIRVTISEVRRQKQRDADLRDDGDQQAGSQAA